MIPIELQFIRYNLELRKLSYDEAKEKAKPIIDEMNKKAKVIANKFGKKHSNFTFTQLMR